MNPIEEDDDNSAQVSNDATIEEEDTEQETQAEMKDEEDEQENPKLDMN